MRLLIDLRTGEPAMDLEGNFMEVSIQRGFNQYLDCLFHTPIMSEPFVPNWGLDIRAIIQASSDPNWESIIKYLFLNAVSKRQEPLVESIESIEVSKDGSDLLVEIHAQSKYGTSTKNVVNLTD